MGQGNGRRTCGRREWDTVSNASRHAGYVTNCPDGWWYVMMPDARYIGVYRAVSDACNPKREAEAVLRVSEFLQESR